MNVQILDSPLRCPRCSKRMAMRIGQDDSTGAGDMRATHECWHCQYSEIDKNWSRPLGTDRARTPMRELLHRLRTEGVEIPLVYSTEPFPAGEFDADS